MVHFSMSFFTISQVLPIILPQHLEKRLAKEILDELASLMKKQDSRR